MAAEITSPDKDLAARLRDFADRLIDIAGCVGAEAETATTVIRGLTDQASRMASLATGLEAAANLMQASVRQQADALTLARTSLTTNKPVIEALERSIDSVTLISAAIATIAQESRILSLNARIEAARTGDGGGAFAVVAGEMSTLATRTMRATSDVGERASLIARDVNAVNDVVASHATLVLEQDDLLAVSLESATRQRGTAAELAAITAETADTVDRAASAIGRVGANAVAVKMLARQIGKLGKMIG